MSDDPGRPDDEPGWAAPPGGEPSDWWGDPASGGEEAALAS